MVVQTIAATRTSRGLHVEAVLDPGDYPTGVAVSKERFTALPLDRHATHGTWNYTLRPAAAAPAISEGSTGQLSSPARRRQEMLAKLNDERLTGTTSDGLARLCAALAPLQAARAQQRYSQQRGGRARRATGNIRARPLFDDAARLLLTILYQRQVCSMNGNCKEITWRVWVGCLMLRYGDLAGGSWSARVEVRGAVASSERAAAAVAAGDGGPVAGAWRGPGRRPGRGGE